MICYKTKIAKRMVYLKPIFILTPVTYKYYLSALMLFAIDLKVTENGKILGGFY